MKLNHQEKSKLQTNYGFTPDELEQADKFVEMLESGKHGAYYKLGALMGVMSQRRFKEQDIKYVYNKRPLGRLGTALDKRYGKYIRPSSWGDHESYLKVNGDSRTECTGVFSPYQLSLKDMKDIVTFCDEYDLDCEIAGIIGELYFPGHAIDIWITANSVHQARRDRQEGINHKESPV